MSSDVYEPDFQIKLRREFVSEACLAKRHKDCANAYCVCDCHITDRAMQVQEAA